MLGYQHTLHELEVRCTAHKLAAEHYSSLDESLKLAASVVSVVAASASYWNAFENVPIVGYILSALATSTAVLNVVAAKLKASDTADRHFATAKKLEAVWVSCVGETLVNLSPEAKLALIKKSTVDAAAALHEAPLLPKKYSQRAEEIVDKRSSSNAQPVQDGPTP